MESCLTLRKLNGDHKETELEQCQEHQTLELRGMYHTLMTIKRKIKEHDKCRAKKECARY